MAESGRFLEAKYAGYCYGCGEHIEPGDRIYFEVTNHGGERRSWCVECAEAEFDVEDKEMRGR